MYLEKRISDENTMRSDSVENAEREIGLWFEEGEVLEWKQEMEGWIYE